LSASQAISTSVQHVDGIAVLAVGGVVDLATSATLEEVVAGLVDERPVALIIDLSEVTFLASVGLQILVATHEKVSPSARYAVVAAGPVTARPIQLTRLDDVFPLHATLDDALADLRDGDATV
jgi:anti-sigma B factor antagonist